MFEEEEEDADEDFDSSLGSGDEEVVHEEPSSDTKRPAKSKARKEAYKDEDLIGSLKKMSVSTKPFSMDFVCPYIMYEYLEDGRQCCSVDFLVPNQHRRFFRLHIEAGGKELSLRIVVPPVFYDPRRLLFANTGDGDFNRNTEKATAFEKQCKKIIQACGEPVHGVTSLADDDEEIVSSKQVVRLPFDCEEDLWRGAALNRDGFEVLAIENDDVVLTNEMGEATDFFILTVDLVSVEKEKQKKARGIMRKVVSPRVGTRTQQQQNDGGMEEE